MERRGYLVYKTIKLLASFAVTLRQQQKDAVCTAIMTLYIEINFKVRKGS